MKALVTGGSGFIGSHIAEVLERRNYEFAIFDIQDPIHAFSGKFIGGDLLHIPTQLSLGQYDAIFHCAGLLGTETLFDRVG